MHCAKLPILSNLIIKQICEAETVIITITMPAHALNFLCTVLAFSHVIIIPII